VPKIRHVLSGRAGMRVFGDHVVELQDGGAPLDKTTSCSAAACAPNGQGAWLSNEMPRM
jgi:hypothetical protein